MKRVFVILLVCFFIASTGTAYADSSNTNTNDCSTSQAVYNQACIDNATSNIITTKISTTAISISLTILNYAALIVLFYLVLLLIALGLSLGSGFDFVSYITLGNLTVFHPSERGISLKTVIIFSIIFLTIILTGSTGHLIIKIFTKIDDILKDMFNAVSS